MGGVMTSRDQLFPSFHVCLPGKFVFLLCRVKQQAVLLLLRCTVNVVLLCRLSLGCRRVLIQLSVRMCTSIHLVW